ncbi:MULTISPECIES: hypothetical protein [Bacteroidaceae]|uniref:hypothetical protein n=1 Tax=Bacteroidaceae TaxID=815 RepID=UPI00131F1E74|nr:MULTISPECIES: hypothetical protein [Bacteroidaceae]MCR1846379.1 hypothetical protein [Phocaeicola sartorii]NUL01213.1 hypothetical protein [Phocaeicola sartorii]
MVCYPWVIGSLVPKWFVWVYYSQDRDRWSGQTARAFTEDETRDGKMDREV